MIKSLLTSKKFVVTVLNLIALLAVKLGAPETTATELAVLLAPAVTYVLAQGRADQGKEAAKIK